MKQVLLAALIAGVTLTASAQSFKMTTPIAPGVAVPDKVESSIGTLNLSYGYPDEATVEKIYDNLDRSRALQAYLMAIPVVNQAGMRESLRKVGAVNQTNAIWENLVDARTVELTANDNTVYSFVWLDTKQGPLVVDVPPKVLGTIDDFWYRWVADIGITGADHGQGRQIPGAASRLQGQGSVRLLRRAAEHVRQLHVLPVVRRGWLYQAGCRSGQEDVPGSPARRDASADHELREYVGRTSERSSRPVTTRSGSC